ncbi:MAG: saccharopine dehydrogenase [Crocinitomicaceae bacterium]|nr:saccharopine dehydrogenase [Crocinitomicaceae bacterium]
MAKKRTKSPGKTRAKSSATTRVVVLGGGMVGSVIASDLAASRGMKVTVVDASKKALARCEARSPRKIKTRVADLSDEKELRKTIAEADLVVGALASRLGLRTLEIVLDEGRDYVDISFMPEDNLHLHELAKRRRVTAVVDMGVAPGMSNLLCGWATRKLKKCRRLEILVGGLPRNRHWPWEYKAGFAPSDVLEEYTRPVRVVEGGEIVWKEALTEPTLVDFEGIGTLETFLTDGLRSLADTLDVPDMVEKTMRYPGHIELMRVMRHLGLFRQDEVELPSGVRVSPLELTSHLLFPQWTFEDFEPDCTVMRITAEGDLGKVPTRLTWSLVDHLDSETGYTSMSRTTGFPAAVVARMIADGSLRKRGLFAPEQIAGEKGLLDRMMKELADRGVNYRAEAEAIE